MVSFENFSILTDESNPCRLFKKESLLVSKHKLLSHKKANSIFFQSISFPLIMIYYICLLYLFCKRLALKDHCFYFNHVVSLENFSILTYELNPYRLFIKESLLVWKDQPHSNKQAKSISFQSVSLPFIMIYYSLDSF